MYKRNKTVLSLGTSLRSTYPTLQHENILSSVGLELFKTVPILGEFNFCAGNYYIDPEELKSTQARMINNFIWYEQDMEKFPRFPLQKKAPITVEFPSVLTTK